MDPTKIIIIGAGQVASNLGSALLNAGYHIMQVFNRSARNGQNLSNLLGDYTDYVSRIEDIRVDADLYIIAVKDSAIPEMAQKLRNRLTAHSMVVHVSGATPSTALSPYFDRFGCFYPLQTFSHEVQVNFRNIPICIHSSNPELENLLQIIASRISSHVRKVDDHERAVLHVAAVFANNFTNHLFHQAKSILDEANLEFSLLYPLAQQTVDKIKLIDPKNAQTGPAVRNDTLSMRKHLELINYDPSLTSIYETLSESITKTHRLES